MDNFNYAALCVLIVDDSPTNLRTLYEIIQPLGARCLVAGSGPEALRIARDELPAVVLLDVVMPEMDGLTTCQILKASPGCSETSVIFVSARTEVEDKIVGLEAGGVDYIERPFDAAEVRARVRIHLELARLRDNLSRHASRLERELGVAQAMRAAAAARLPPVLSGDSRAVRKVRGWLARVSVNSDSIAIWAPSGAGAEAVARQVHNLSEQSGQPFIHVLCSNHAGRNTQSFFGSGENPTPSPLELARGGTVFLEMAHLLGENTQVQIAEVLGQSTDVRLICSLPHNGTRGLADVVAPLRALLTEQIALPRLDQRLDDLEVLASELLLRAAVRFDRPGRVLSPGALESLAAHDWPGNLAELRTVIERAVMYADNEVVDIDQSMIGGRAPVGSYRLIERIAQGGMGEVWRARHHLLAVPAAVKQIRFADEGDLEARRKTTASFRDEATATAELRSPHTVSLFDFGVREDGSYYYVMEYLDGLNLRQIVEISGPMPAARVIHLLEQACDSLSEAHAAGLIHHDIKPANLMACRLGHRLDVLKVVDFGVVKRVHHVETEAEQRNFCGTPGYIGPEVSTPPFTVDHRTDLYALGCVAYYLLAGERMYPDCDSSMGLLVRHAEEPPDPLPAFVEAPEELITLVYRCLAKKPDERPRSASAVGRALRRMAAEHPWTHDQAEAWWHERGSSPAPGLGAIATQRGRFQIGQE